MRVSLNRSLPVWWHRSCKWLLACCWCVGLLAGACSAASISNSFFLLMRAAQSGVSIFGLLMTALLPFLFTALAVFLSEPRLFLPIAFCKAFSFAYCGVGIGLAYGLAGWLVRFLLLFSDGCLIPVLYWFWLKHISDLRRSAPIELASGCGFAILAGLLNYGLISPLTAMLIHF